MRENDAVSLMEAVCEFRLTSDTPWDLAVPGLFYEKVKDTFPRRKQRTVQEIEIRAGSNGLQRHPRTNERIMFLTEDQKMVIQVGPRLLAINALRPYPTWQGFKARIEMAWKSLQHVVEVKGIQRLGLRHVHALALPARNVKLSEYFEFHPFVTRKLRQQMVSFLMGTEFSFADDRDRCRVQLVGPPPDAGEKRRFVLDIYHFLFQPCAVEIADAMSWIETAHDHVEEVFEECITDKLREILGGKQGKS
jgi:uncharacterized protein (TIGR04255 family)